MTEHQAMQKRGAEACAAGLSEIDCPLYRPEQMPAATGEPVSEWSARADAWRAGYVAESAIRG